jgi:hypothetical protein
MKGTFRPGDKLFIEEIPFVQIERGDVIVFCGKSEGKDEPIVHRVVAKCSTGLIMRGDNNSKNDASPVTEKDIRGRVDRIERKGKSRRVSNGRAGLLRAEVLRIKLHVLQAIKFFLRKPYRLIGRSVFVAKLWQPEIEVIRFETPDGPLLKYLHKGRSVATCWPKKNRWSFKRPYEFFLGSRNDSLRSRI